MKEPLIKRVDDNTSKGKTYSALLRKYKEAMENGFYGEAELVVYAFLEDRLRPFLEVFYLFLRYIRMAWIQRCFSMLTLWERRI